MVVTEEPGVSGHPDEPTPDGGFQSRRHRTTGAATVMCVCLDGTGDPVNLWIGDFDGCGATLAAHPGSVVDQAGGGFFPDVHTLDQFTPCADKPWVRAPDFAGGDEPVRITVVPLLHVIDHASWGKRDGRGTAPARRVVHSDSVSSAESSASASAVSACCSSHCAKRLVPSCSLMGLGSSKVISQPYGTVATGRPSTYSITSQY